MIRFPFEHFGDYWMHPAMLKFSELIFDLSLVEFPLLGKTFMRSNSHMWFRLDKFLVSLECESPYPDVCQKRLPRLSLDHFLILLKCGGIIQREHRNFKFKNM